MKRMMLLTVFLLMVGMVGFTQAQMSPVVCGDLAEADCEILQQNHQAMLGLESSAFSLNADFTLANIPDMPNNVTFSMSGSGAVSGDTSALVMSPDMTMTMMSDPEAYADFMTTLFEAVDVEMSIVLNLPPELVEETNGDVPARIPLDIVLVDGVGYMNFSTLRDAVGEAGESFPEGWYGIDISGLVGEALAMSDAMGSMSGMDMMDPEAFAQFSDPEFLSNFMRVERLDDTTAADGSAVASFHTEVDYQALMSDPAMQDLIMQSVQAQGEEISEADMAEISAMMSQMFQGLTLDIFTTIGLDDFYTRSTQVTMNFDMESIVMLMGPEMGDDMPEGPAPVLMFNLNITQSDFNSVETITAPENATVIPLESLGMMGGMPGGAMSSDAASTDPQMMMPTATPSG
jgi:hypothetical protein